MGRKKKKKGDPQPKYSLKLSKTLTLINDYRTGAGMLTYWLAQRLKMPIKGHFAPLVTLPELEHLTSLPSDADVGEAMKLCVRDSDAVIIFCTDFQSPAALSILQETKLRHKPVLMTADCADPVAPLQFLRNEVRHHNKPVENLFITGLPHVRDDSTLRLTLEKMIETIQRETT
jgi:hypothetical protein